MADHQHHADDDDDDADTVDDALAFMEEEEEAEAEAARQAAAAESAGTKATPQRKPDPIGSSQHNSEREEDEEELVEEDDEMVEEVEVTEGEEYDEEEIDEEFVDEEYVEQSEKKGSEHHVKEEEEEEVVAAVEEKSGENRVVEDSLTSAAEDDHQHNEKEDPVSGDGEEVKGGGTEEAATAAASEPDRSSTPEPALEAAAAAAVVAVVTPSLSEDHVLPTEAVGSSSMEEEIESSYIPASPPTVVSSMMSSATEAVSTTISPPPYAPPSPPTPEPVQQPKRYVEMPPPSPVYYVAASDQQEQQQDEFNMIASPLPSPRGKSGGRRTSAWVEDEPTDEMGMRMNELNNLVETKMLGAAGAGPSAPILPIQEEEREESKHPDDEPHDPLDEYNIDQDHHEDDDHDDDLPHDEEEEEEAVEQDKNEEEVELEASERTEDDHQIVDGYEEQHQEHQYEDESENNEAKYKSDDAPPEEARTEQYEDEYTLDGPPSTDYDTASRDVEAGQKDDTTKKRRTVGNEDDSSNMVMIICALICGVMVILAIVIGVVLARRNNSSDSTDKGPSPPASWPTKSPVEKTEYPSTLMPSFATTPAPIGMVEVQRFAGSADDPGFGSAVTLTGDLLVIGAMVDGSPGSVNIYQKTNSARWLQEEGLDYFGNAYAPSARIAMSEFAPNETQAEFGTSIDLALDPNSTTVDGSGLVVGAPGVFMKGLTVNAGAAYFYLFNLEKNAWLQHGSTMSGGTKLTNSNEEFGASVAASNNLRVVVGAPGNNDGSVRAGRVYIFEYKELDWVPVLTEPLIGQGEEGLFGASVDINPAGDMIAIGEPGSQSFTILERDETSGVWTQTFQLPIRETGGSLGSAVKILSADYIAVGASQTKEGSGSVRLYQKSSESGVWEEYGDIFYDEAGDQIGASGSLDGALGLDGPVIVVGTSTGSVKRLDFVNERWFVVTETEPGSVISSIAYSPDSNEILVGRSTDDTVGFYEEGEGLPPPPSTGTPPTSEPGIESTTPPGTTTPPGLGTSVPGSAPPDTAQPPTTAPLGTSQAPTGAVPLATLEPTAVTGATASPTLASTPLSSESGWQVTHGPLSSPQANSGFGKSVSLGTNLFVTGLPSLASGAVQTSSNVNGLGWTSLDDLSEVNATQFGATVDLITGSSQSSLLVGAPETVDPLFVQPLGAAFFYELSGDAWIRLGSVIQPVATPEEVNGKFGAAVAAAAGRVCIGAPESNTINDSGTRLSSGRVYTFTYDGTDWQESADQVFGSAAYDRLGASIAMTANGAFLLVGAPGPGTANGVVFYYAWSGSAWLEILSVTGTSSESLGASVAIISEDGGLIAMGGPTFAGGAGVVRVYAQGSGSYIQIGSDIVGSLDDKFGTSLTGSNGRVVIGSSQGGFHAFDFDATIGDWVEVSIAPVTNSAVTDISTTGDATNVLVGLSSEEVLVYELSAQ